MPGLFEKLLVDTNNANNGVRANKATIDLHGCCRLCMKIAENEISLKPKKAPGMPPRGLTVKG